jgi:hypothetical protein
MSSADDVGFTAGSAGIIMRTTNGGVTGFSQTSNEIPPGYSLSQNYPNPFNPSTKISFSIPLSRGVPTEGGRGVFTRLSIFNLLGQNVKTLVNEALQPGSYEIEFDASKLPTGTYFYRLSTDGFTETKKMILIK